MCAASHSRAQVPLVDLPPPSGPIPVLYRAEWSPPCRTVMLTEHCLGISLQYYDMNLCAGRQFDDFYKPINKMHTIPSLDDNGHFIGDSHAIAIYLVTKYAKDDTLYPHCMKHRSLVNMRMFFEAGCVYPLIKRTVLSLRLIGNIANREMLNEEANEAYKFLNIFLEGQLWVAGPNTTLADFCLISSITSLHFLSPMDEEKYSNVTAWMKRMDALPYYPANRVGLWRFMQYMRSLVPPNFFD